MISRMELQKITHNRSLVLLTFLFVLLNFSVTFYLDQDDHNGKYAFSPAGYRSLQAQIQDMENEEAAQYVDKQLTSLLEGDGSNLQYENLYYEEYFLFSSVYEEINNCIGYAEATEETLRCAANFSVLGTDGLSDGFVLRNYEQMQKDYAEMAEWSVEHGPAKGITLFSQNVVTDLLAVSLLLVFVQHLFTRERQTGELLLYKATRYARTRLAFSKITAVACCALLIVFLFYGTNLALAWSLYDIGDPARALQSVPLFSNSVFRISVGKYLILFFLFKFLACLCALGLFCLLSVCSRRSGALYVSVVVCYGVSFALYFGMDANSRWNLFKYMNFYGIFRTDCIFQYRNFNIARIPCSYVSVYLVFCALALFVSLYLGAALFQNQREAQLKKHVKGAIVRREITSRSHSLFLHEAYKLLWNGRAFLLIVVCAVGIFLTQRPLSEEFALTQDAYYDAYVDILSGSVTAEKLTYIENETKRYERVVRRYEAGGLSDAAYEDRMKSYDAFCRLRDEKLPYLQSVNGHFIKEYGYDLLTGGKTAGKKDVKMALFTVAILIFPFSYLYGAEYQQGTSVFLHTYYMGTRRTFWRKWVLGMLLLTVVYCFVYLPFYVAVFQEFGMEGLTAPARSLNHLYRLPSGWSIGFYLVFVAVLRYAGLQLVMLVLMAASRITKSFIGNAVAGMILVVLPLLFSYLEVPGVRYVLLNPLLLGNVWIL